ncbi:UDP-2,3-diacylglucosamine diphosphatase [Pelomonas sp. CA6]|uniref:UDP-2,3-diacylglucosamine diphosphatase n=1 Tax=Pelomonas sp. CA6 TaxID=2907999 RepID=UPI0027DF5CC3|nr:UDP-2,3-diacylglucosamine diphosphatase [Pelomonas sp. CA6]
MSRLPLPSPLHELVAPAAWQRLDLLSDLHLSPQTPRTLAALREHLRATDADAVFLLGDIFEAWVGDDARLEPGFEAEALALLREASARRPLFFVHGNRDFLLGEAMARDAGLTLLPDPFRLIAFGRRWLVSHGDALCLDDHAYQAARVQLRDPRWQAQVLAQPLAARRLLAQQMRAQSQAAQALPENWADVDEAACRDWLTESGCPVLIHGHTHRPGTYELGDGRQRWVLSDWELDGGAPRADVLRLDAQGLQRHAPCGA